MFRHRENLLFKAQFALKGKPSNSAVFCMQRIFAVSGCVSVALKRLFFVKSVLHFTENYGSNCGYFQFFSMYVTFSFMPKRSYNFQVTLFELKAKGKYIYLLIHNSMVFQMSVQLGCWLKKTKLWKRIRGFVK